MRAAAEPQIAAFLGAGFTIASERWVDDAASAGGAPIGDAIASGPLSYLAGHGGALVIIYQATIPTDLPAVVPTYTLRDPRAQNLRTWSQLQIGAAVALVVIFALVFLMILQQMSASSRMPGFGP
ncbi:MAG: hypothetical protein ABSB75_04445 [Candidatus Limnocylindrales bacterium]